MELSGSQIIMQFLKDEGVEYVFGYPGGAVLHIYDEIYEQDDVKHILVRHEQGATHMADGYARATGKPGVVLVTSGPRRHECGHRHRDRAHGLDPHGGDYRTGTHPCDRQRRVPGGRLRRNHPSVRQAQLSRQGCPRAGRHAQEGVLRGHHRTSRPGRRRHSEGRDPARPQDSVRVPERGDDAVLQPRHAGALGADPQGARPHPLREAPDDLHRRRSRARRCGGGARQVHPHPGLPDHQHPDGARRVPRDGSAVHRHARHARDV